MPDGCAVSDFLKNILSHTFNIQNVTEEPSGKEITYITITKPCLLTYTPIIFVKLKEALSSEHLLCRLREIVLFYLIFGDATARWLSNVKIICSSNIINS